MLSAMDGKLPGKDTLDSVTAHSLGDVNQLSLAMQLELLTTAMNSSPRPSLKTVRDFLHSLSPNQWSNLSEVCTLLKLSLVSPATNAVNERSTSALQRVKSYLHSTRSQERLNYLL